MLYTRKSFRKNETEWVFVSHDKVKFSELKQHVHSPPQAPMWLKAEPMIVHVCAKTMENAVAMLNAARDSGFKRAGIITAGNRIILEITGTEVIDALISRGKKPLVSDDYVKALVAEGNRKLKRNFGRIKKFEKVLKGMKI